MVYLWECYGLSVVERCVVCPLEDDGFGIVGFSHA